jgi:hypothetical protein
MLKHGVWHTSMGFGWRVWHIFKAKNVILSCHRKRRLALFIMVRRVVLFGKWFVADGYFFVFFPIILSLLSKVHINSLFFFFAILVLRFFIIYLVLDSFGKVFYVFNFIIELQFFMYYFLRFGFYSFDFWFFFLVLLLKFYCF